MLYNYQYGAQNMYVLKLWDYDFETELADFNYLNCWNCTNVWASSGPDSDGTEWEITAHVEYPRDYSP